MLIIKDPNLTQEHWAKMDFKDIESWIEDNQKDSILITNDFVAKDTKIILTPDDRLFLKHITDDLSITKLYELPRNIKTLPADCTIKARISDVKSDDLQNISAYIKQLMRIVGQSTDLGTLQSHRRLQIKSSLSTQKFMSAPWRMQAGYNNSTGLKGGLKHWSFKDPWSRREYLELLSVYEGLQTSTAAHLDNIYAKAQSEALVKQSMYYLTSAYFIFPNGYDRNPPKFPDTARIYENDIAFDDVKAMIKDIETDQQDKGRWNEVKKTPHQILAASLYNPDIFTSLIKSNLIPIDAPNPYGKTTLMFAAHLNMHGQAAALIKVGADINTATHQTNTKLRNYRVTSNTPRFVLDYALENAQIELIDMVLDKGAKLAPCHKDKHTCNHPALDKILGLNAYLSDAQKARLKQTVLPRDITPKTPKR